MVYVTGDTHGVSFEYGFLKLVTFADANKHLTKDDYVIISGDAGIVWSKRELASSIEVYEDLPFSILYVDGNHENFDLLNKYKVEEWNGGKTHKISDNIRHLMRGQVFTIEGKTIFTFGGAESTDKQYRVKGHSWWKQEVPNEEEFNEGISNLAKVGNKVDYIITHTIDAHTLSLPHMKEYLYRLADTSRMLNHFEDNVEYKKWFYGHFHEDKQVTDKKTLLYNKIIEL